MLTVTYSKPEVIKTWLSLAIEKRRELLSFKDTDLITLVNFINTSLVLTANECLKGTYEILESIDTYWTEPFSMKIKPALIKGKKLIHLLESKYSDFLLGSKQLYLDPSDHRKIFETGLNTWDSFQLAVCKLIEQAFLTAHFNKLSEISRKAAVEILKKSEGKKANGKNVTEVKDVKDMEDKEEWFDLKDFIVDIGSDISTDIDEKDLNEILLFDVNCCGGKSYKLRKFYANVAMEWDNEVVKLLDQEVFGNHSLDELANLPIVAYYDCFRKYM